MKPTNRVRCESYKDISDVRFLLYMAYTCDSETEKKKLLDKALIEIDKYIWTDYAEYRA